MKYNGDPVGFYIQDFVGITVWKKVPIGVDEGFKGFWVEGTFEGIGP